MKHFFKISGVLFLCLFFDVTLWAWGFFAHKEINRLAVFTLPPEMITFYKKNIEFIAQNAVNPDKRRYTVKEEAARHFIDLDIYPDSMRYSMPKYWHQAVTIFSQDTLNKYGIVPWHIYLMKFKLTDAFKNKKEKDILRFSSEIAHYIADSNVPLHTTANYNGQMTNQHGIHGFWESRLPELYSNEYNFFTGRACYLPDVQETVWKGVYQAQAALDSVLSFEKELNQRFPADKKYSMEERNGITVKVYSEEYANAFHQVLHHQVERQMTASVKLVGDIWYTCWIDAGQPNLDKMSIENIPENIDIPGQSNSSLLENCIH